MMVDRVTTGNLLERLGSDPRMTLERFEECVNRAAAKYDLRIINRKVQRVGGIRKKKERKDQGKLFDTTKQEKEAEIEESVNISHRVQLTLASNYTSMILTVRTYGQKRIYLLKDGVYEFEARNVMEEKKDYLKIIRSLTEEIERGAT
jgi:hypothetical protein